jgi:heparanase
LFCTPLSPSLRTSHGSPPCPLCAHPRRYGLDPALASDAWSTTFLAKISTVSSSIVTAIQSLNWKGEIWVGESAMAWHSGREGVTDTFLSSPWWLSALASLAPTHSGFCRQTLMGGNYELVNKTTKMPNPDFYVARLFKDTMGSAVLKADSNDTSVHAWAHCAPESGGVTLAYINFQTEPVSVLVSGVGAAAPRSQWMLTSSDNTTLSLNGAPLTFTPGSNTLPPLGPNLVTDPAKPLVLPPRSMGFVSFTSAAAANCKIITE